MTASIWRPSKAGENGILRFIVRRLAHGIPVLLGAVLLAFLLVRLPSGDAADALSGERGGTEQRLSAQRAALGLDQPLWRQFCGYVARLAAGDFGVSITTQTPVLTEFRALFPATLELLAAALPPAAALGVALGAWCAQRRGTWADRLVSTAGLLAAAAPPFWLALGSIWLFSLRLGWAPTSGRLDLSIDLPTITGFMLIDAALTTDAGAFISALRHLALPALTLAAAAFGVFARVARASVSETLTHDYVRAARARGVSETGVLWRYALPNAAAPLLALAGLQTGALLGGAMLTETIFAWPGVGKWLVDALRQRDYPVLQGGVLLIAALVTLVNLAADMAQRMIDPRVEKGEI